MDELTHLAQTLPAVLPITADRITRIAYQNQYRIFQHSDLEAARNRPLALVAYHEKEDVYEGSLHRNYIRKFYHFKIGELFNMSLLEFFKMEMCEADFLCEMGKSHIRQFEKSSSEVEKQLNLDFNQQPGKK